MPFWTEFFSRPRPGAERRVSAAMRFLEGLSPGDRADIGIRPADFPRIARNMAAGRHGDPRPL
jgi:hypothetical protein